MGLKKLNMYKDIFLKMAGPDVSSAFQLEVAQGLGRHHKIHGKSTVLRERTVGKELHSR